jgi:predicted GIY-YIG superfamily endonuclease
MTTTPHALYRFFDAGGQLLYVGISLDPGARWKQHRSDKPWWGEVATVTVEPHETRAAVVQAERAAIIAEKPKYNVVHNRGSSEAAALLDFMEPDDPSQMPDMCHDICAPDGIYGMFYPYRWRQGTAYYQCTKGHRWTCGWAGTASGDAPENRGVDQARVDRLMRAKAGERIHAYLTRLRQTSDGLVIGVVGDCPFCGRKHTHGLGDDINDPEIGSRASHCYAGASYYLTATTRMWAEPLGLTPSPPVFAPPQSGGPDDRP